MSVEFLVGFVLGWQAALGFAAKSQEHWIPLVSFKDSLDTAALSQQVQSR